jgi:alkylresorcinol/alkylpyrone synthase
MPRIVSSHIEPCPYSYGQEELLAAVHPVFKESVDTERYAGIFRGSGIRTRSFAAPLERLVEPDGWLERSGIFVEEGTRLGDAALTGALERAGLGPGDLGHLFFISTTGIATPSIDARILGRGPWRDSTLRTPVWGLGCAGGISGLARAADWVRAHPGKAAAVLAVEFCSLTFMPRDLSLANFVAAALFADGVACAVVAGDDLAGRCAPGGLEIASHRVRLFPDTLDVMGWNPVEHGLQVVFSRRIPAIVREHSGGEFQELLASAGIEAAGVKTFLGHPGGPKVLDAYGEALGWPRERFAMAWKCLEKWGNVSSASLLHVLAMAFEEGVIAALSGDYALLAALGPGFTSEQLLALLV